MADSKPVRAGNWLLDRALEGLANHDGVVIPGTTYFTFTEPAWDAVSQDISSDCAAQLTVWAQQVYPSAPVFPVQAQSLIRCGVPWVGVYLVQLVRCAPTINDEGGTDPAEVDAANAALLNEAWWISQRIACQFGHDWEGTIGLVTSTGVLGDRMGANIPVTIDLS